MKTALSIILGLFVLASASSGERMANPCWSTHLGPKEKQVCQKICLPLAEYKFQQLCKNEADSVAACLQDFSNCQDYQEILNQKDNCKTKIVIDCLKVVR